MKGDSQYASIKAVNKFLFRASKLQNDDDFCVFVPETLSIGLSKEVEELENGYVNPSGEFLAYTGDRYGSLLHKLIHFMNTIDSFGGSAKCADIDLRYGTDIIENIGVVSKLRFLKKEIYSKKKREGSEEANAESNEEFDDEKLKDIREKLEKTLGNLYGNGTETWTMHGIFIWKDKQNSGEYGFYYDPVNEAVADTECKIINGEQKQVVKTEHGIRNKSVG